MVISVPPGLPADHHISHPTPGIACHEGMWQPQRRSAVVVVVKVVAGTQPMLPTPPAGMPFVPVEFAGMTVTPYVNQAGRLAYSLKAAGIRPAGRSARTAGDPKDAAA
jgi:hypothetical protein